MRDIDKIIRCIESKNQITGKNRNTLYRMTGKKCDVDKSGILEVACAGNFDRWANSSFCSFDLEYLKWEGSNIRKVIRKAINLFN